MRFTKALVPKSEIRKRILADRQFAKLLELIPEEEHAAVQAYYDRQVERAEADDR